MSGERAPSARAALEADYEIIRELGIGGTAIVYLARNRATGIEVAVKLIRSAYLEDEEALARFAREARYASRIDHPNVVAIREVLPLGGGGVALVMAHVPGRTLKQLIRDEGALPPARVEHILRDVAAGLSAAHALDIIHRDVKPENIFIDESGDALLADFGLARSTNADTQLTMTGVAVGTPTYMPPEQIDGGTIDARGDVYSLGLVGWEMLTGKRPWDGDSLYALLYHQKHDYLPDVREFRDDVPDVLANVIATAIEKTPDARWQSVAEMIAALDGVIPARRASVPRIASDTVRFARPARVPAAPDAAPPLPAAASPALASTALASPAAPSHLAVLNSIAGELEPVRPRRRFLLLGTLLASMIAIVVVAFAWSSRRSRANDSETGLRPMLPAVVANSLATRDSIASAGTSPVSTPRADSASPIPSADSAMVRPAGGVETDARRAEALSPMNANASKAPSIAARTPASTAPASTSPSVAPSKPQSASSNASVVATSPPSAAPPPMLSAVAPRATIVAGGLHTCLVASDGRAYCWGSNTRGQLGTASSARATVPTAIGGNLDVSTLTAGLSHSCALVQGGAAWCWGENDHGQLGDRSNTARSSPVRVADGHVFRAIAAGASHTCALDSDGAAWCWGAGAHGQLGTGNTSDANSPMAVPNWRFVALAAGWNFTCGLDASGRAFCWGENDAGQLGTRDTIDRSQPAAVSGDLTFISIAAGSGHACAVAAQGDAYCWGKNSSGQLGDGTTTSRATPALVKRASDAPFTSVTAGAMHTCAIDSDGQARCWGLDAYGQLGDGGNRNQTQPVLVTGGHRFASLRAFGSHTCGSTVAGEAFCWGYNLEGQLGDGTRTNRSRPVYLEPPIGR